jgi:dolichol kinase
MDEQKQYQRWLDAELEDRDDDADALFGTVLKGTLPPVQASAAFTERTMTAVTEAAARDLRRARTRRRVLLPVVSIVAVVLAYLCSGLMMSAFSAVVVKSLDLLIAAVVYVSTTMRSGGDAWTLAGSLGKATAALLTNPVVTTTILALQGMAVAALIGLQRLLRSERT